MTAKKIEIQIKKLGLMGYNEVWDIQKQLFNEIITSKNKSKKDETNFGGYIITCQHKHVITLGKSGDEGNILFPSGMLKFPNVEYLKIDRGGDVTYHGPGQLVVYPILDLEKFGIGLKEYIYKLEEAVIETLKKYNIESGRIKEYTGVWINNDKKNARKIAAIGVKSSRYVTMHGLAFNIKPDLNYFELIIPCGIKDKSVTSLENELGIEVDFDEVSNEFIRNFQKLLNV